MNQRCEMTYCMQSNCAIIDMSGGFYNEYEKCDSNDDSNDDESISNCMFLKVESRSNKWNYNP